MDGRARAAVSIPAIQRSIDPLLHRFQPHPRRVAPEVFEAVERALFRVENVDDHVGVIGHDPLTHGEAVDRHRAHAVVLFQAFLELVDDCLEVRLGRARADDKVVRETRDAAEVERDDVLSFFVRNDRGDRLNEFVGFNEAPPGRAGAAR